mmetsp:Transcript_2489/g.6461  ORF Transcript_2489/g.6461 Transcript_2489/m.6461 type:complete len:215 (+) Transcript_2489:429-1073(+)
MRRLHLGVFSRGSLAAAARARWLTITGNGASQPPRGSLRALTHRSDLHLLCVLRVGDEDDVIAVTVDRVPPVARQLFRGHSDRLRRGNHHSVRVSRGAGHPSNCRGAAWLRLQAAWSLRASVGGRGPRQLAESRPASMLLQALGRRQTPERRRGLGGSASPSARHLAVLCKWRRAEVWSLGSVHRSLTRGCPALHRRIQAFQKRSLLAPAVLSV